MQQLQKDSIKIHLPRMRILRTKLTKMARAIITVKLMPETAEVNLSKLEEKATKIIKELGGDVGRVEKEPIAFGLMSLKITFIADETKGTDEFEQRLEAMEDVQTAQVIDYRRAIG